MAEPKALVPVRPAYDAGQPAAVAIAEAWSAEREQYLRQTFCAGAPAEIADAFIFLCRHRRLSPEAKQIYCIGRYSRAAGKTLYTNQVSIDGYRSIAAQTGDYAGSGEYVYEGWEKPEGGLAHPLKATTTVYRFVRGQVCAFTHSVFWDEYNANQGNWLTMPAHMLGKCSEAGALRKGFPELAGVYTDDEMGRAGAIETTAREVPARQAAQANDPDRRQLALSALHAMVADRGAADAHAALKLLQAHLFDPFDGESGDLRAVESFRNVNVWTIAELRDLYRRIKAMPDADFAMIVTSEDAPAAPETAVIDGSAVEVETGEIVGDRRPMTQREKLLAQWRDAGESATTAEGWTAILAEFTGTDEDVWLVLAMGCPVLKGIELMRAESRRRKCNTADLESAFNLRAREIRAASNAATP